MSIELPKQLWNLTVIMRNGQGASITTELGPTDIDSIMESGIGGTAQINIPGRMPDKEWPIYLRVLGTEVIGWFVKPEGQYLATRKLSLQ